MRVADRISTEILEELMERGIRIPKKDYLNCECVIADIIIKRVKGILAWETDLQDIEKVLV